MAQKKDTKKNVKVRDLAPKKDAKGGASADASADSRRNINSARLDGRTADGGTGRLS